MRVRAVALAATLTIFGGVFLAFPFCSPASASGPLNVVVTIPVLKDLAIQVGGPHVSVHSLLSGLESEHTYSPKPSDLVAIRNARVLLEVGVGLEVWVRSLIRNAGNPRLLVVTTSKGIALIRKRGQKADRLGAGLRGQQLGNPHVWLDPENAKVMVRHITEAFIQTDSGHAKVYRNNQAEYLRQLDELQRELVNRVRGLTDRRVIVHHPAWPYFARRFGFSIEGEIVSQVGAEPSAKHLQALVKRIRDKRIRVIVSEPQLNQKIPQVLARETDARVVVLTPLPGGIPGTQTYLDMLRYDVLELAKALERS
ncbi:MAG: zinc ABC transporter substrate-binding protein [Nitrospirae bacterium]|nr:zinc ABC transporter substrate-binding protein [Nitrospirota bacterium]